MEWVFSDWNFTRKRMERESRSKAQTQEHSPERSSFHVTERVLMMGSFFVGDRGVRCGVFYKSKELIRREKDWPGPSAVQPGDPRDIEKGWNATQVKLWKSFITDVVLSNEFPSA